MTETRFDVLGIGNAIVDLLARVDDDFLVREKLAKGTMHLIDEERAHELYRHIANAHLVSGGSAANTCVGVASLGARAAFIGKVKDDHLGKNFTDDIRKAGVHFETPPAKNGPTTASCTIIVTPDGERTMNTFLGASQNLKIADVDAELVRASGTVYLEGYLWDPPEANQAYRHASNIAQEPGRKVSLSLSDSFCVERHRPEFLDMIRSGAVDLLFANEYEAQALYETSDFNAALAALRKDVKAAVVTRSEKGAVWISGKDTVEAPAHPIDHVVDATGAGDLFAAGVLTGLARDLAPAESLRLGAICAAEILSHMGARPQQDLAKFAKGQGLGSPVLLRNLPCRY
jgi:adenosine kinase